MASNLALPEGFEIEYDPNGQLPEGFEVENEPIKGQATITAYKPPTVIEKLKNAWEWTTQVPYAAFMEQKKDNEAAALRTKGMMLRKAGKDLSDEEKARISELDDPFNAGKFNQSNNYGIEEPKYIYESEANFIPRAATGIKKFYAECMKQTGIYYSMLKDLGVGAGVGAAAGGLIGGIATRNPQGIFAGVKTGASVLARTAVAKKSFELEAGFMRQELEQLNDEFISNGNQPLSDSEMDNLSMAVGTINASLEYVGLGAILKTLPNGEKILGNFGKEGIKNLAKDATFRTQLADLSAKLAVAGISEGSTEATQEYVNFVYDNLARKMKGVTPQPLAERIDGIMQAGLIGTVCAVTMGGVGTATQVAAIKTKRGIDSKTAKKEAESMNIDERNDFINDNIETLAEVANEQADEKIKTLQGEVTYNRIKDEMERQGASTEVADNSAQLVQQAYNVISDKFGEEGKDLLAKSNLQVLINSASKKQVEDEKNFVDSTLKTRQTQTFNPNELKTDAQTFQYKENSDEEGVTDRLNGVQEFDPLYAGNIIVYETKAGDKYVVDGHQRLGLAKRLGNKNTKLEGYLFKEADGYTPEQMRLLAAQKNIAEGSGTAIDTAKIIKEIGLNNLPKTIPTNSAMVKNGISLSKLGDTAFQKVVNGEIPTNEAAIVAEILRNDENKQIAAIDYINKKRDNFKNLNQVELFCNEVAATDTRITKQTNLFGDFNVFETVAIEKIQLVDKAIKSLQSDKKVFNGLLRNDSKIKGKGKNKLDKQTNAKIAQEAAVAVDLVQKLSSRQGIIADKANQLATMVKDGEINLDEAAKEFKAYVLTKEVIDEIYGRVKQEISYNQSAIDKEAKNTDNIYTALSNTQESEEGIFTPEEFYRKGLYQDKIDTKTQNFKKWFGDSKVVDSKGKPLKLKNNDNVYIVDGLSNNGISKYTYKGAHRAPSYSEGDVQDRIENSDDVNLSEVAQGQHNQPVDYFDTIGARYYGYDDVEGQESATAVRTVQRAIKSGKKNITVTVYRAIPSDVRNTNLKNGDWITLSKSYAKVHGETNLDNGYKVIEDKVPIENVWWDGNDIREWGYDNGQGSEADLYVSIQNPAYSDELPENWKEARKLRDEGGYDGVITSDGKYLAFEKTQIKSTYNQGTFDSENPNIYNQGKRGQFRIDEDGTAIIDILENGDASTVVHELGHFYLYSLQTLAETNTRAAKELEEVNKWLGVSNDVKYTQDQLVEFHEKFARGFEAYLYEGNAPTKQLKSVFENFKDWLKKIYNSTKDLDIEFSEATQMLFDRVFTTDEEYEKQVLPKYQLNYAKTIEIQNIANSPAYKFKKGLTETKEKFSLWYDKLFIPIETRLGKISPALRDKLRNHTAKLALIKGKDFEVATDFFKKTEAMKKTNEEDYIKLDLALKNRDEIMVRILSEKYGFKAEFEKIRDMLEDIYNDALSVGLDLGYLDSYYPRLVKSDLTEKYLEYIEMLATKERKDVVNQVIKLEDAKISMILKDLKEADPNGFWNAEDRAKFINNRVRGFGKNNILLSRNASLKFERKIDELDENFNQFYETFEPALVNYISNSRDVIEGRKFFGSEIKEVGKLRARIKRKKATFEEVAERKPNVAKYKEITRIKYELSPIEIKIEQLENQEELTLDQQGLLEGLKRKQDRLKSQLEWTEEATPFQVKSVVKKRLQKEIHDAAKEIKDLIGDEANVEDSIGALITKLSQKGEIYAKDERLIRDMLMARFNASRVCEPIKMIRDLSYIATLNDITNAITQFGDLAFSVYKYGFSDTFRGLKKPFEITREDLGLNDMAYEFTNSSSLSKWLKKQFEVIGLTPIDGLGKNAIIQASLLNAKKQANANSKEFSEKLQRMYGENSEAVKADLAAGKVTDDTIIYAFHELSDIQPISEDQVTELYQSGGGYMKLFYTLKTYGIKALDVARQDITTNIQEGIRKKNKGQVKKGFQNLIRLQMLLWLFGVPIDALKDLLSNRDFNMFETMIDNLIPFFILSRYTIKDVFDSGVGTALANFFTPSIFSTASKALSGRKSAVSHIPLIGKPLYNWLLKDK